MATTVKPTVIVADTDIISHFIKADEVEAITQIFTTPICLPTHVCEELQAHKGTSFNSKVGSLLSSGKLAVITPSEVDCDEFDMEYTRLRKLQYRGKGESACMALAKLSKDVAIASNNLNDIAAYCKLHSIVYLTTCDFLYKAWKAGIFTEERCNIFIGKINTPEKNWLHITKIAEHKPMYDLDQL